MRNLRKNDQIFAWTCPIMTSSILFLEKLHLFEKSYKRLHDLAYRNFIDALTKDVSMAWTNNTIDLLLYIFFIVRFMKLGISDH